MQISLTMRKPEAFIALSGLLTTRTCKESVMASRKLKHVGDLFNGPEYHGLGYYFDPELRPDIQAKVRVKFKKAQHKKDDDLYKLRHPEKIKARAKRYYEENIEIIKEKSRVRCAENSVANVLRAKIWREENPERHRAAQNKYDRKLQSTPMGKLNHNVSSLMGHYVKGTRTTASEGKRHLPYTMEELRTHLEKQFLPGMSWDNRRKWHIDHIIPLANFKFTSVDDPDFKAAWALTNLRPIWASKNMSKGKKRTTLL